MLSSRRTTSPTFLAVVGIILITIVAYIPAIYARFIWDDNSITMNPQLRSLRGLYEIWFVPGSSSFEEHYWPVTYTFLWVGQQLWGNTPAGYHILNVALHAFNSVMVMLLLQRLRVGGAIYAGFLFALHPVHVESVAWAIELKDVLSGAFYLGAAWAYVESSERENGDWWKYALLCLLCFTAGILAKSVVITLPAVIVAYHWWRHIRLRRRHVIMLGILGIIGVLHIVLDMTLVRSSGVSDFPISKAGRVLIASRAIWFYLGKLAWPWPLVPLYPTWNVSAAELWQYGYVLATLTLIGSAFVWRRELGRGPVFALTFYLVTLLPMLGFVSFSFMKHTYVADRFQYLASMGPIALAAAGAAYLQHRWRGAGHTLVASVCVIYAILTYNQSRVYYNLYSFFEHTLRYNPDSWAAHFGLAEAYWSGGLPANLPRAEKQFQDALQLKPTYMDTYWKLASVQMRLDKNREALRTLNLGLRLEPGHWQMRYTRAVVFSKLGENPRAEQELATLIGERPQSLEARNARGLVLKQMGRSTEAQEEFRQVLKLDPQNPIASKSLF